MKIRLLWLLLAALVQTISYAQSKTYVLVHGGWHGAWCWKKVIPRLEATGNRVVAIDLPGHGEDKTSPATVTLDEYTKQIVQTANAQTGPVILVGHSMAGVVIAQAAEVLGKEKVAKLVFLDAFMPKNGESVLALAAKAEALNKAAGKPAPGPSLSQCLLLADDKKTAVVDPDRVGQLFYHDCRADDVAYAKAHVSPQPLACLGTPVQVTDARYGAIPKVYILCTQAKDLDKRSIAKNVPIQKMYTLASSHSPFFSMPEKLVAILQTL
ncbi:alpha/beta fold hydrolase [Spirosoma sp. KNUC1025]|uniref:alpha/beta fold hydrolase n=1 Tax=Spirosoma sp. KNUC1025 TaxID=2894082 RepID=UPI001E5BFA53|nr:alpha/beta fold hydrolase [Spirosoma sp. KNUC1025]UFH57590.1 alpha/beta fold hydrolase [Spirosoma sp. KNUC1025]